MNNIIIQSIAKKKTMFLLLSLLTMLLTPTTPIVSKAMGATGTSFDNVVIILMENNGYCDVITTCGGSGPYETSLAQTYSIAGTCQSDSSCSSGGYTATSHPSEGNYISLVGGDNFGQTNDGYCCWGLTQPNIIDRIESAGLTWQAYAEDASGSGTCNFYPPRQADHFAFLTFRDMYVASRCSHFLATSSPTDTEFLAALNSPNPPNYIWLTPNDSDNGHDSGVSGGDSYLSRLVPNILSSNLFKTQRATLFITYDEGGSNYPTDYVYASWSGPVLKKGYVGTGSYSHYSLLKTLEVNWGLSSLTSNDANAGPMTDFFTSAATPPGNQPGNGGRCLLCPITNLSGLSLLVIGGALGAILAVAAYLIASHRRSRTESTDSTQREPRIDDGD